MSSIFIVDNCYSDTDWYRSLVGSFEEREKVLVDENCGLREGLMNVQQELLAILTTNATHAISDEVHTIAHLTRC